MIQGTLDGWLCAAGDCATGACDVGRAPDVGGVGGAPRLAPDAPPACDAAGSDQLSALTRTRARGVACAHGRRRCRECGKGYCPCGMRRDDCRQCGIRFCPCGRRKDCCAKCGGSQVRLRVYLDADKVRIELRSD